MHDIDAQISKISGSNDYMEQLQKITGNINQVDMNLWRTKLSSICRADTNINKLLTALKAEDSAINATADEYITLSTKLDLTNKALTIQIKKRKNKPTREREVISSGYHPSDLVKTPWFKAIKHLEKNINRFLTEIFDPGVDEEAEPDDKNQKPRRAVNPLLNKPFDPTFMTYSFADLEKIYNAHPDLASIKKCLNLSITKDTVYRSMILIKRCCNDVINILLLPMYDVRKTIESHWQEIDRIFKSKAFQQASKQAGAPGLSQDDIIDILHKFIIAKYRASITGSNKHYVKLFMETVGNDNISNIDGARFIEIMDAVDIDQFNKKDKVYLFASKAKQVMKQIAKHEHITPAMVEELSQIMNADELTEETPEREITEEEKTLDDALA